MPSVGRRSPAPPPHASPAAASAASRRPATTWRCMRRRRSYADADVPRRVRSASGPLAAMAPRRDQPRQQRAGGEPGRDRGQRVLADDDRGAVGGLLGAGGDRLRRGLGRLLLRGVRRPGDLGLGLVELARDLALGLVDLVLGARLDVGLLGQRGGGLGELLARALDVAPDLLRRPGVVRGAHRRASWTCSLVYRTSSLTVSTVCSGTGGPARRARARPISASTPAIASHATPTITAASQPGIAVSRARMAAAVSAPKPKSARTPPAPSMPAPMPASLPLAVSSTFASSSSWRTSVETCVERSLTSSPVGRSRSAPSAPVVVVGPASIWLISPDRLP